MALGGGRRSYYAPGNNGFQIGNLPQFQSNQPSSPMSSPFDIGQPGEPSPEQGGFGSAPASFSAQGPSLTSTNPAAASAVSSALGAVANPGRSAAAAMGIPGFNVGPVGFNPTATGINQTIGQITNALGIPGVAVSGLQGLAGLVSSEISQAIADMNFNIDDPNTVDQSPTPSQQNAINNTLGIAPPAAVPSYSIKGPVNTPVDITQDTGNTQGFTGNVNQGFMGEDPTGIDQGDTGVTGNAAAAAAAAASDASTGVSGGVGDAGAGVGDGGAGGGPSGDGPSGGTFKRGGIVKKPSPKHLADKLRTHGGKLNKGDHDDNTDDVPVKLTRGEMVVNKKATQKFQPQLQAMNQMGLPGGGGMNVGRSKAQSSKPSRG